MAVACRPRTGPPEGQQLGGAPVPYDSSLSCARTAAVLDLPALAVAEQLRRMRAQLATGELD